MTELIEGEYGLTLKYLLFRYVMSMIKSIRSKEIRIIRYNTSERYSNIIIIEPRKHLYIYDLSYKLYIYNHSDNILKIILCIKKEGTNYKKNNIQTLSTYIDKLYNNNIINYYPIMLKPKQVYYLNDICHENIKVLNGHRILITIYNYNECNFTLFGSYSWNE